MFNDIPLTERPAHVPPERVIDFDIYNINVPDAEYQVYLRDTLQAPGVPDIFWSPRYGGHWVTTRAATTRAVLTRHQDFSSSKLVVIRELNPDPPFAPLQIDPPDHTLYRNLLMKAFSPQAVSILGEDARKLAIELIQGFKARGECEFIGDFASHLPIRIFMTMVNLPESDRPELLHIADQLVRGHTVEDHKAGQKRLAAYAMQKIAERRAKPGDDLISELTQAKVNGEPMSDYTLLGMLTLLLIAGLDTVATMMGFFARFLALNATYRQELIANPAKASTAVEELLRRFPIANLGREVCRDCELDGVQLRAGDMVLVPTAVFGMDDRQFDDPEKVDFDRKNKIHATFGDGPHRCMGSMLARVELKVFLEEWLKEIPDFNVKPGVQLRVSSGSVAGLRELPLVWSI